MRKKMRLFSAFLAMILLLQNAVPAAASGNAAGWGKTGEEIPAEETEESEEENPGEEEIREGRIPKPESQRTERIRIRTLW